MDEMRMMMMLIQLELIVMMSGGVESLQRSNDLGRTGWRRDGHPPARLVPGGGGDEQTASDGRRTYRPSDDEPARLDADDSNCWRNGPAGRPPIRGSGGKPTDGGRIWRNSRCCCCCRSATVTDC
jgi:hypothetical protein